VLAVMLKGSWNDDDIPLIATDASGTKYATAIELAPGRYHYHYKVRHLL